MTNEKLRFGLVGTGGIAKSYVEAFHKSDSAEVIAVADVRKEAAEDLAKGLTRCLSFDSAEEMAESVLLDAAIVCTPPASHEPIVLELTVRGINVLCEKPF